MLTVATIITARPATTTTINTPTPPPTQAEYVPVGGTPGTGIKFEVDASEPHIQLTGLTVGQQYDVYVRSKNAAGYSDPSAALPKPFTYTPAVGV